jgi:hypothetical protein
MNFKVSKFVNLRWLDSLLLTKPEAGTGRIGRWKTGRWKTGV